LYCIYGCSMIGIQEMPYVGDDIDDDDDDEVLMMLVID